MKEEIYQLRPVRRVQRKEKLIKTANIATNKKN
jgi:hypothetical protein